MKRVPMGALEGWAQLSKHGEEVDVGRVLWHPTQLAELSAGVLRKPVFRAVGEERAQPEGHECHRGTPTLC